MSVYIVVACLTFLIFCTTSFVAYNKKSWGVRNAEDLGGALGLSFVCSVLWFIVLPAIVLIGGSWFLAKSISKSPKEKP